MGESAIVDLDRRVSRAIQTARGIQLDSGELDVLVAVGAIDALKSAAGNELRILSSTREQQRAERAANPPENAAERAEEARVALERARRVLGKLPNREGVKALHSAYAQNSSPNLDQGEKPERNSPG